MEVEHQLHSTYGNKRPFTVPDHYFSDLSSQIMANIPVEEPVKTPDNTLKTKEIALCSYSSGASVGNRSSHDRYCHDCFLVVC